MNSVGCKINTHIRATAFRMVCGGIVSLILRCRVSIKEQIISMLLSHRKVEGNFLITVLGDEAIAE